MTWHRAAVFAAAVLGLTTPALAADPSPTPAAKWEAIQKEMKDASDAYTKAVRGLPQTPESRDKAAELRKEIYAKQKDWQNAAVELAKDDPKSDAAWSALQWVLTVSQDYREPAGKTALKLAIEYHAAKPEIGIVFARVFAHNPYGILFAPDELTELLHAVVKQNPDRDARGQAMMGLAAQARGKSSLAESTESADRDALAAEAVKAFEAVVKDYGDCPSLEPGAKEETLGDQAKQRIFELQHLRVGMAAPEIEGEDLDGKKFKLSDYRGKAVLLVFWGAWATSPEMYAEWRSLIKRMEGKPFVLLGVNNDKDKDAPKKAMEKEKMDFRSWWDGPQGGRGPLAKSWDIHGWPTVYVLDSKGVIRRKGNRGKYLEDAVDRLVKRQTAAAFAANPPAPTPIAKLEAIQKGVQDAEADYLQASKDLPDTPESAKKRGELFNDYLKKQSDGFTAAADLIAADPKSDTAFAALEWLLTTPRAYYTPAGKPALELATDYYADSPKIGKSVAFVGAVFPRGSGAPSDEAAAFLKAVAAKNPDRNVRGQAALGLADRKNAAFAEAEVKKSPNTEAMAAEAENALQAVVKDYGDCPWLIRENRGTLGERAKQELFELQHLRVGMVAPEIEGEDLAGVKFKLSDYRGKVVMLDFWGNW